jgi:copper(I)-binding protein
MLTRRFAATLLASAVLATPAFAQSYRVGSLEIEQPWTRATAPTAPTAGGYLKIVNTGTTADRLVAVRSTASARTEIHEMKMDGSVMRMRELEKGLEIPAGATVMLQPGGYHVMFMQLKEPFKEGAKVPVTLVFEKAGSVDVVFTVNAMGTMPKMSH